jgi:hypothetical protein
MNGQLHDARVLQVIRDEGPITFAELCSKFGLHDAAHPTSTWSGALKSCLHSSVHRLHDAKLIRLIDERPDSVLELNSNICVVENWYGIQSSLGISLTELCNRSVNPITVQPYFGIPSVDLTYDITVLMPFKKEFSAIYHDHIRKVANTIGITIARGDDLFTSHSIMSDIWSLIYNSKVIIADCTGKNPNVFYEIGIAHTIGKPVILITQKTADVPFDLRHIRYILYEYTEPGMRLFETSLEQTIRLTIGID